MKSGKGFGSSNSALPNQGQAMELVQFNRQVKERSDPVYCSSSD